MSGGSARNPRTRPKVVILDYGSGNLRSAERAVVRAGADVELTGDPDRAEGADGLVVPGVGAFAACMSGLGSVDGPRVIRQRIAAQRPVLAICVGHQILFAEGDEHGLRVPGCGVWPGRVEKIHADRLPHMGWNRVATPMGSIMFAGVEQERFYFVHSFAVRDMADTPGRMLTWAHHGGDRFLAAVQEGALWSTQFHPEKSGDAGAVLIRNWVSTLVPSAVEPEPRVAAEPG